MTPAEVAKAAMCSIDVVRNRIRGGELKAIKIVGVWNGCQQGRWFIEESDAEVFVEQYRNRLIKKINKTAQDVYKLTSNSTLDKLKRRIEE